MRLVLAEVLKDGDGFSLLRVYWFVFHAFMILRSRANLSQTVVCGIIAAIGLPNNLATARFLTPIEREIALERIRQDRPSQDDSSQ